MSAAEKSIDTDEVNAAEIERDVRAAIDWLREALEEMKGERIAAAALSARKAAVAVRHLSAALYTAAAVLHDIPTTDSALRRAAGIEAKQAA